MKKKKTRTLLIIISVVIIIAGLLVLLYPQFDNWYYNQEQNKIIEDYENQISNNVNKSKTKGNNQKSDNIELERLYKDIKSYNKKIYKEEQSNLIDKKSYEVASFNLMDYGFKNNVYGYITIDKININMAIYLGASEYNMSLGAAHLSQTSIPIGGKNTNSVIAGHCGYGGRQMFRYIENLSVGDEVKITTPFNKLTYKVVDKKTIKPNALENIKIQKGKDMITLFTCTPYPTSKYRCCVFCERVK